MTNITPAFAQSFPDITPIPPDRFNSVSDVLLLVVNGFLILAGLLAVIYIIWAGLAYITSAGDPEKAQKARNGILYAAIGIVVISLSFAIVGAVSDLIGSSGQSNPPGQSNPAQGPQMPPQQGPRLPGTGGTGQGGGPEGP